MKIKEKLKRTLCILLSSLMMVVSPVSSAFTNVQEVEAAAAGTLLGAGALSLFEMMCGALGVTFTGMYAAYKTDLALQFIQALRDGDADAMADAFVKFDPATAKKLTLTTKCWDTLKSLLSDKFGNLKSGKIQYDLGDKYTEYGSLSGPASYLFQCFNQYPNVWIPYGVYYIGCNSSDTGVVWKARCESVDYLTTDSDLTARILVETSENYLYVFEYYIESGQFTGYNTILSFDEYTYNPSKNNFFNRDNVSAPSSTGAHRFDSFRTNMPFVKSVYSLSQILSKQFSYSEIVTGSLYGTIEKKSVSFGTYDEKNIDALTDKEIPAEAIEKIVGTINS